MIQHGCLSPVTKISEVHADSKGIFGGNFKQHNHMNDDNNAMGDHDRQTNKRSLQWDPEQFSSSSPRPISQCQDESPLGATNPFTNAHHSDDYRCFSPEHKRMRFSQDWNGMAVSPESTVPAIIEEREPTVVQWWKQRKHNNHLVQQPYNNNHQAPGGTYHRSNDLCHVCQNPYRRPTITTSCHSSAKKPPKVGVKHHKTILSYFTPRAPHHQHASATGRSSVILPVPSADSTEPYRCCTFCDRADVCSDCRNVCGTCEQWFCKFCTTTDYSTDPIRIVCLDCHQQQQPKENGPGMELSATARTTSICQQDAMQID